MDRVNLNSLRIFATAARQGSFQRAAEVLSLSQGAVSQRIRQLEAELGVTLFDRLARGVALTATGQRYFTAIDAALASIAEATEALSEGENRVTLHLGSSFAAKWLMPRRRDFAARFPGLTLATETHESLLRRPLGRNELAIFPASAPPPEGAMQHRRLCALGLVALCSPDLPRPEGPIALPDLLRLPLLQDSNRRWERLINDAGVVGAEILNVERSALALDAAMQGHGVALVPSVLAEAELRAGRLVAIWRPEREAAGEAEAHYYLGWSRHHDGEQPLRQVLDWIIGAFERDSSLGERT